ncbi:MAG: GatB/YqeY domain-containing protein [Paludibacteraceae bacterium]|nr:GatB/YqeY domain-containing protein [Paludibacteraceae bacterium]
MDIFQQVSEGIKTAMLNRDKVTLEALRNIKKELLEAKTSKECNGELTDATALKVIQKMAKQSKDAAQMFVEQKRQDLADEYLAQVKVMEQFLPKQMSREEIVEAIKKIIGEEGVTSLKEMGKVMGRASKELSGRAEGRTISEVVKSLLQ